MKFSHLKRSSLKVNPKSNRTWTNKKFKDNSYRTKGCRMQATLKYTPLFENPKAETLTEGGTKNL